MHARSWQARGHVGAVLNHSRSLMRRIVFSTDMRPGTPDAEEAIHRLHRLLRLFFALLMQDCRLNQDLERVPSDVLTPKEKDELAHVRRRPLMVIGWCQATIRRLAREGHISERISLRMEDHLEAISQAYHGCTKIRSQPMPFSYSQVMTTVRAAILSVADALLGYAAHRDAAILAMDLLTMALLTIAAHRAAVAPLLLQRAHHLHHLLQLCHLRAHVCDGPRLLRYASRAPSTSTNTHVLTHSLTHTRTHARTHARTHSLNSVTKLLLQVSTTSAQSFPTPSARTPTTSHLRPSRGSSTRTWAPTSCSGWCSSRPKTQAKYGRPARRRRLLGRGWPHLDAVPRASSGAGDACSVPL